MVFLEKNTEFFDRVFFQVELLIFLLIQFCTCLISEVWDEYLIPPESPTSPRICCNGSFYTSFDYLEMIPIIVSECTFRSGGSIRSIYESAQSLVSEFFLEEFDKWSRESS